MLLGSYVFYYTAWNPPYIAILLFSTVLDWWLARRIWLSRNEGRRKVLVDERRFPRRVFWEMFVKDAMVNAIHFEDEPTLNDFICPDGSHLDYRDRDRFSRALGEIVKRAISARQGT